MCVCKSPAVSSRGEYLSKSSETVCPEKHRQTAFYSPLVSSDPQPSALRQLVTRVPHFENTLDCNVFFIDVLICDSQKRSADICRSTGSAVQIYIDRTAIIALFCNSHQAARLHIRCNRCRLHIAQR